MRIIGVYKLLCDHHETIISRQLLASATSIGANIREAFAASSRKDFINKMTIASKEARESKYWLELIQTSKIIDIDVLDLINLNNELIKLLNSIILTSKGETRRK
ncbi:MAG: four helix bundle protein [Bacteroidales bacterium]|nr:four helix bundle protein [Bacteroidales bacterium]